jgi:beta-lactamase regulating signal transducer with metallopeptidase domain
MIAESILWVLLVQSTACLAAGLAGSNLLRRRAARAHQVLLTGLLAALLLPATYLLVRHFQWGLLAAPTALPDVSTEVLAMEDTAMEDEATFEAAAIVPVYEATTAPVPWVAIGMIGWATATVLLLGRLLLRFVLGLRLLRRATLVETPALCEALRTAKDRISAAGPVELRTSDDVHSPVIWCWRRAPVLLVHKQPQNAKTCDWVGVFCHELAHWRRLDHVSGLLAELLAAVLPWHPLTWWARTRLSQLSEEVCDDWVLASGQLGVDYAESLLDLAPQRQMAFLPTVVGKERIMKTRIHRIVTDSCGNPTVGGRWTLGVTVLAIGIAASVALAQPGRAPRTPGQPQPVMEPGPRPARNQALALEGRRNVLERMLDQLRSQARDTEAALLTQGDPSSEKSQVLRGELAALRNHIQMAERQLANLGQPQPDGPVPPVRPMVERARRANERLLDLRAKAQQTRRELSEVGDTGSPRAQRLAESLKATQQEIRTLEAQLDRPQERAVATRGQVQAAELPARQRQNQAVRQQEQTRPAVQAERRVRPDQLQTKIKELELRLQGLEEQGKSDSEEGRALRNNLRTLRNELRDIRQATPATDTPAARQQPALRQQRAQLQQQIAAAEQRLAQLQNKNGDEAGQLRARLQRLHAEIQKIDGPVNLPQAAGPRKATAERPVQTEIEQLRGQVNGLNEQMRQMQKLLEQLVAQKEAAR